MAGTTAMMRSLVSPQFGEPSIYELRDGEMPNVKKPTEILIKVEAASINAHDVIMASGRTKAIQVLPLPYPIGLDFAGTVLDSGSAVSSCGPGDSVYGFSAAGGTAATHLLLDTAKAHTHAIACIPAGLGMVEAAGLPAVAITAMLALQHADNFLPGGLQGKTVFIPGALSGVGSIALQIAKRKYNARTLTAASGGKIPKIGDCLGQEVVDTVFDYTQVNVTKKIGKGEVDFVFDTTGLASEYLPMIKRGGLCLSIARLPPGSALKDESPDAPHQSRLACIGQNVMDGMDNAFRTWAKTMYGVVYVYQKTEPNNSHMQELNNLIQSGVLQPVIGKTAGLNEIEKIRDGCTAILKGKGGIGKFVILMDDEN